MKIFQGIRWHYAILGIRLYNQPAAKLPISARVFAGFAMFGCIFGSQLMYICYVANGFMDYMQAACASSSTVIIFVCFASIALRQDTLSESIDMIEQLIETSESHFGFYFIYMTYSNALSLIPPWNYSL